MTRDGCDFCCQPGQLALNRQTWQVQVSQVLCAIWEEMGGSATPTTTRYDWEFLCDPDTAVPVVVQFEYDTTGTISPYAAFNLDGTPYAGAITDLVACVGGGGASNVNLAQIAGTAASVNSGSLDAGTLRVAIATDDINISVINTNIAAILSDTGSIATDTGNIATDTGNIATDTGTLAGGVSGGFYQENLAQVAGTATAVSSGVLNAGTQRVAIATDDINLAILSGGVSGGFYQENLAQVAGTATAVSSGVLNAGTQRVAIATDDVNLAILSGGVSSAKYQTQLTPKTSGGWSFTRYSAQTTTVQTLKGSPGQLGGYIVYNPNATAVYIQIFNTAGAVTLGTTVPDLSIALPATAGANVEFVQGIAFSAAIKLAVTTTATGSTAPVTGADLNMLYA